MKVSADKYGSRNFRGVVRDLPRPIQLAREGAHGRKWYVNAHSSIQAYAERHGFDPGRVADVVAILSPRVHVSRNVAMADTYLRTGSVEAMRQRLTALERYEATGTISGNKIREFAKGLRGDPDAAVVDVWMVRAYGIDPWSGTDKQFRGAMTSIRRTAGALGWGAAETQAAIWVGARARCGYTIEDTALTMPL